MCQYPVAYLFPAADSEKIVDKIIAKRNKLVGQKLYQ